jgi:signal peptidase I
MLDPSPLLHSPESSHDPIALSTNPLSRKKPWLAAVLTLFFPGLGQLYAHQPRKGLAIAVGLSLIGFLALGARVLQYPVGLAIWLLAGITTRVFAVLDAARSAKVQNQTAIPSGHSRTAYSAMAAIVIAAAFFPTSGQFLAHSKGFRVPSASMCPTICVGDRIIADMSAYQAKAPQRGDLIMLHTKFNASLFIKRVIASGGDTVKEGDSGEILVNGVALQPIAICGNSKIDRQRESSQFQIHFCPVTLPAGSFFVVGDNLDHSLDSRTPDFGLVTQDQIRGKPLYFYWSPDHSRIGCRVR